MALMEFLKEILFQFRHCNVWPKYLGHGLFC